MKTLDLWRHNPWKAASHQLNPMQREMNDLWDNFLSTNMPQNMQTWDFTPTCDVDETATHYNFHFDLPGMNRDNVRVEIHNNLLQVTGERHDERREEKKTRHVIERTYGKFQRSFTLPASIDAERVEAAFKDGVLKVAIPKQEATRAREVQIKIQ